MLCPQVSDNGSHGSLFECCARVQGAHVVVVAEANIGADDSNVAALRTHISFIIPFDDPKYMLTDKHSSAQLRGAALGAPQ